MKAIVAIEGQGYEADTKSIKIFHSLTATLVNCEKEYTTIGVIRTSGTPDNEKVRAYKQKLIKDQVLIFEREGGFWLQIREKEVVF